MKSLYVASTEADAVELRREFELREANGFRVHWLERPEIEARFRIAAPAAIVSDDAAEVDPFRLTQALLRRARERGVKVYETTEVTEVRGAHGRGAQEGSVLTTTRGRIRARHVIMATGYESQAHIRRQVVELKSSYVIVSRPVPRLRDHWLRDHLFWETARPYLYVRTTIDQRIVVGGEDEAIVDDRKRDALIPEKARRLRDRFRALVPDLPLEIAYAWAGTFGETADGMGYVGTPAGWKDVHFALGFGGNGITFAVVAADLLCREIRGEPSRDARLFSFRRRGDGPKRPARGARLKGAYRRTFRSARAPS